MIKVEKTSSYFRISIAAKASLQMFYNLESGLTTLNTAKIYFLISSVSNSRYQTDPCSPESAFAILFIHHHPHIFVP